MLKINSEYAICLCIQIFSSSGMNLILGRMKRMIVLQTGNRMSMPSTLRTRPAPRDIHTEYCNVLRPARRGSLSCFHHPYAKMPQWNVQNKTWNTSLEGVNCFLTSERSGILAMLTPPLLNCCDTPRESVDLRPVDVDLGFVGFDPLDPSAARSCPPKLL